MRLPFKQKQAIYIFTSCIIIFAASCKKSDNSTVANNITTTGSMYVLDTQSFTSNATGTSFSWNFGDGTTSAEASPTHVYSNTGTYTVTLKVNGASSSEVITILYGAKRYAKSYNWQGGYHHVVNIPVDSSHALNDTIFALTLINDSTLSCMGKYNKLFKLFFLFI